MKIIPTLGEIKSKAILSLKRFPLVLTWVIIGTIFTIAIIEKKLFNILIYQKLIMTFTLGVSWLISSRFFEEQFKKDRKWISIIIILLLLLFNYSLIEQNITNLAHSSKIRFWLYIVIGHIFVIVAPFIFRWHKNSFFNYVKNIAIAIFRSGFFTIIIYAGIALALLAVENLFDYRIKSERYLQLFVFCLGIINTWIYLSDFPKNIYTDTKVNFSKPLEVLVKSILIPLIILYLVILYAYSLKIIVQWNLPRGWVSYLVIALSFIGFIVQTLINPVQKTIKSRLINNFSPWFYYLLLPLIVLLFIGIFRRISEYGFTEKRYLVLCLSLWILATTLYMLISKRKEIRFLPLGLISLFLIISVGFWGMFSVSNKSQLNRFKTSFDIIKEKEFKVALHEKNQFRDITKYLYTRNHLEKIAPIIGFNPITAFKKDKSSWGMSQKIIDTFQIEVLNNDDKLPLSKYKSYNFNFDGKTIDVKGYDSLKRLFFNKRNKENDKIGNYNFSIDDISTVLNIFKDEKIEVYSIDLESFINDLSKNNNNQKELNEMTLIREFEGINLKIIFTNLRFQLKKDSFYEKPKIIGATFYVLAKEKK